MWFFHEFWFNLIERGVTKSNSGIEGSVGLIHVVSLFYIYSINDMLAAADIDSTGCGSSE